jgi:predicted ATPase
MSEAFVKEIRLLPAGTEQRVGHPWDLPALADLADGVELHPKVTYLVGENGSGKSTLLAAIALAAGMSAEGGSSNFAFPRDGAAAEPYALSQRALQMGLGEALQLVRGSRRPKTDFFLRAESLFLAATYLEALDCDSLRGASTGTSPPRRFQAVRPRQAPLEHVSWCPRRPPFPRCS